ncbi:MAG TPA: hypothetical protein VM784_05250 [Actinomycetota bacterium]|nr:hypothetical protein [Actinomycetota bacterium]
MRLEIECVDRLYLNAYVPNLQVSGQVANFFTRHRGDPIPSPALMEKNGNRFRREVKAFAAANGIPILTLKKPDRSRWDDRKLDHVRPYLERAERAGRFGVVAIVVATQEFQWVFSAKDRSPGPGVVSYDFVKEERRVGTYHSTHKGCVAADCKVAVNTHTAPIGFRGWCRHREAVPDKCHCFRCPSRPPGAVKHRYRACGRLRRGAP